MKIVIASGKGGTGKTTVSVALAQAFDGPVCLIDADVEEPNSAFFMKPIIESKRDVTVPVPQIDSEKCTACGVCVGICPRGIMALIPRTQEVYLSCVNKDRGPAVKKTCQVGCIACRLCVRKNPEGDEGITMGENLPIINYEKLASWPEANEICPQNCFATRKATA